MRRSEQKINRSLKGSLDEIFFQTIADLKTSQSAKEFLTSFLTESELDIFSKRLAVAYWLRKGRSYSNIKENLKVSSATIASVQTMMTQKGVQDAIKTIEADEWANQWSEKIKAFVKK